MRRADHEAAYLTVVPMPMLHRFDDLRASYLPLNGRACARDGGPIWVEGGVGSFDDRFGNESALGHESRPLFLGDPECGTALRF